MLPGLDPVMGSPEVIDACVVPSPQKGDFGRIQLLQQLLESSSILHLAGKAQEMLQKVTLVTLMAGPALAQLPPQKKKKNPKMNTKAEFSPRLMGSLHTGAGRCRGLAHLSARIRPAAHSRVWESSQPSQAWEASQAASPGAPGSMVSTWPRCPPLQ